MRIDAGADHGTKPGLRHPLAAVHVRPEDGGDGAYGDFNAQVAKRTVEAYESGPLGKFGGGPDAVAKVIEKAITADKPKIRYRVTPSARLLVGQRALMTDGMWDRMLASQFPRPGD